MSFAHSDSRAGCALLDGWVGKSARLTRAVWTRHRHLLQTNAAYGVALAALAVALVTQETWPDFIAAAVTELLGIYAATRRLHPPR